ncbi:S-layer homology domain-containing protein [Paenibacillus sp. TRM 82003]|nr:S-layer homology domain-containing protein [Paenibacillus sp. TRM 82003]MCI3923431.1 S-layer homology domain-containing protein [Paenibacillus sp. TRM 82003]
MKRKFRPWLQMALIFSLLVGLLPIGTASAATSITITYPVAVPVNSTTGLPTDNSAVQRFTLNPITLTATVQGVSSDQVPNIYYEITNITTNTTTTEKANKPEYDGQFTITFRNVYLTEGLNKITVKLGETNATASPPVFAYFTPATNITKFEVDGDPFVNNQIYPSNPEQDTVLDMNITAPNATRLQAYLLGASTPIDAYPVPGTSDYAFVADDINKTNSIAHFRLKPGDNFIRFLASNNTKTFTDEKNIIYDNGDPFAFNANVYETDANGVKSGDPMPLISNPTIKTPRVTVDALIKNDVVPTGLEYNFVDVKIGDKTYGPYNLSGYTPAAQISALYPDKLELGGDETNLRTQLFLTGSGLSTDIDLVIKNGGTEVGRLATPVAASDANTLIYTLTGVTLAAAAYTVEAVRGTGASTETLAEFPLAVTNAIATADQAVVDDATVLTSHTLDSAADQTIQFVSAAPLNNVQVQISSATSSTGRTVGNVSGSNIVISASTLNTLTPGKYRVSVKQLNSGTYLPIWEQLFEVKQRDPAAPSFSIVSPQQIPHIANNATYINVMGSNLGLGLGDVTQAKLVEANVTAPATPHEIGLQVFDVSKDNIVFKLGDPSAGDITKTYNLQFELQRKYADGTNFGSSPQPTTVSLSGGAVSFTFQAPADPVYNGEVISDIVLGGASISASTESKLQMLQSESAGTVIRVSGTNLTAGITFQLQPQASGTPLNFPFAPNRVDGTDIVSAFNAAVPEGYYFLKVFNGADQIGHYPISVVAPTIQSFEKNVLPTSEEQLLKVIGTSLGRDEEALYLEIAKPSDNGFTAVRVPAENGTLQGGTRIHFDIEDLNLEEGLYTGQLVYKGTLLAGTSPTSFTVASPTPVLEEVSSRSKAGQYKVFRFEATLDISTDKMQPVRFQFYNFVDDVRKPANEFFFYYENPNLPYIDHAVRILEGNAEIPMVDAASGYNEINEIPAEIGVYANPLTESINVYFDEYTAGKASDIASTDISVENVVDGNGVVVAKLFKFDLDEMTQGRRDMIVVPLSNGVKNYGGRKEYDIQVSSTPYVILNNIHNGLVVDSVNRIGCGTTVPCVTGRLVNVVFDDNRNDAAGYHAEVIVNGKPRKIVAGDFPDSTNPNSFRIEFRNNELTGTNGKVAFKFVIYKDGVKLTESTVEVFVFSENVPQFISIRPIEPTDTVKYIRADNEGNTFVTNEKAVAFTGQFINATEIKLTVRGQDEDGKPFTKTDRRFDNFRNREHPDGALFTQLDTSTFTTGSIELTPTGDTFFEYMITDPSGVVIVKTITITREPLPYVIKYPILVKNSKGEDQANVNGNYSEIILEAEGADAVYFDDEPALKREEPEDGIVYTRFYYEAKNLKAGENDVEFVIVRGEEELEGEFVLYNTNTPIEGAQFKTPLKSSIKAFEGLVELKFPKNTNFMRNDPNAVNQYITSDRELMFGIASKDGRIDKYRHPFPSDGQFDNPNDFVSEAGKVWLSEPTGRFRSASKLIWIDAGTISESRDDFDLDEALGGSGRHPYDGVNFYTRALKDLVVPTQRATLTLKYDDTIRNDSWKYLSVYHFDIFENEQGVVQPRWRNIGGVVDTGKKTITVPVERFGFYQVMYMSQSYDDVIGHEWARDNLDILYSKGVMKNKETNAFVANTPITRGEFTTLLVKLFEIPLQYTETPTFTDVLRYSNQALPLYDYKYIETAARVGIIRGAGGGRFQPDSAISRQDAAVMIARAANLKLASDDAKALSALQKEFTDANLIDVYARSSIDAIVDKGFITGKENVLLAGQKKPTYRFDPAATFTRAEAAAVAIRIMRDQKKIPK